MLKTRGKTLLLSPTSLIHLALLVVLLIYASYSLYTTAESFVIYELSRGGKGYVSDEVWYVSAARNMLSDLYGLKVFNPLTCSATIVLYRSYEYLAVNTLALNYGVNIVDTNYDKLKYALYVESSNCSSLNEFTNELANKYGVKEVVHGWRLPDNDGINDYLNTEHPPLGKYLIALSIILLGDHPFHWRVPSIVSGVLMILLLYYLTLNISGSPWIALLAASLTAIDPLFKALGSIALLDIFVATTSVAAAIAIVKRKYVVASILIGISASFKFNGLFTLIPMMIIHLRNLVRARMDIDLETIYKYIEWLFKNAAIIVVVFLIASTPFIAGYGLGGWLRDTINSLKWHTSEKCPPGRAGCPTSSFPIDWFIGVNAFTLYVNPTVVAMGNYILWTASLWLSILFIPAAKTFKKVGHSLLFLLGILLGYIVLWIMGGRTQYSFYAIHLLPFTYLALALMLEVIVDRNSLKEVFNKWFNSLSYLRKFILTVLA
ncbi:MAG: glycosyltransferase family 39 protein [Desulfurococcaceae archaeon]